MPRTRKEPAAEIIPSNALVASAVRYKGTQAPMFGRHQAWQTEAWRHYYICGELRFVANWIGNALSRSVLYAARMGDDGPERITSGKSKTLMEQLFNGEQPGMMRLLGIHLTVAGECYLVGRNIEGTDVWEVIGIREMNTQGSNWTIEYDDGSSPIVLGENDAVIRIWRPDPSQRMRADSPVRAVLPILQEIEALTRHVMAQVTSRLTGAGIQFLPNSIQFPAPPPGPDGVSLGQAESLMMVIAEAMGAAIENPDTPMARVPIIITVPDDAMEHIKPPIHYWSPLDETAGELRIEAIKRFALGMDIPPEVVTGVANSGTGANHWTAWQIEESSLKIHIEPLLELIANTLTLKYLRAAPGTNARDIVVADTSQLRLRPDRSKEALELYDRGELDGDAVRRETGFGTLDKPDDAEMVRWLLKKIAGGSTTPEQVQAAAAVLGVHLDVAPPERPAVEARPTPSLLEHPSPKAPPERAAAIVAAAEALVFRTFERAGNRLKAQDNRGNMMPGTPSHLLYQFMPPGKSKTVDDCLEDAWTCISEISAIPEDKREKVQAALHAYCHATITEQSPHDPERMVRYLEQLEAL